MKIDAVLYLLVAVFAAITAGLGTDDAAKYIAPATLWYARNVASVLGAGVLALKMYRSTSFADAVAEKKNQTQQNQIQQMDPTKAP